MKQHWFAFAFAFESVSPIHTIYYVLNVSSSYKCTVHHLSSAGKKFCARKQKQRRKKNGNITTAKWICKFRLRLTMSVQRSLVWEIIAVARCRLKLRRLCEVKKKREPNGCLVLKIYLTRCALVQWSGWFATLSASMGMRRFVVVVVVIMRCIRAHQVRYLDFWWVASRASVDFPCMQ